MRSNYPVSEAGRPCLSRRDGLGLGANGSEFFRAAVWAGVDDDFPLGGDRQNRRRWPDFPISDSDVSPEFASLLLIRRTPMNKAALQAVLLVAAGFLLVVLVIRRRKRRQHRQS